MSHSVQKLFSNQNTFTSLSSILLVMLAIMSGQLQAAVSASLDRQTINLGDTVILRITTSGDDQGKQPDLTPLENQFEVLGTSNSSEIQIINGQRSDKHQWLIELSPLNKGTISIPVLSVGNRTTTALTLQVNEQPAATTAEAGEPVFIQSEINTLQGETYVQQQILYTTRLYYQVPITEVSFTRPKIENAVVEQLGEDKQYETTIKGQSYQVFERRYAVFPEHSGLLDIPAIVFDGHMVTETDSLSSFSRMDNLIDKMLSQRGFNGPIFGDSLFSSPGKKIRLASNPKSLEIKPRPESYTGTYWLPTENLILEDSWENSPPVVRVGEPITRTLTLRAKGLEASQLPDITIQGSDTLRIYPEQPVLDNQTDGDWVYGSSEQDFTYVASSPGSVHIPAIQITWWDSVNQKQQDSVLPARDFTVLEGSNSSSTASSSVQAQQTNQAAQPTNTIKANGPPSVNKPSVANDKKYWLLGWGLVVSLLLLVGYVFIHRQRKTRQPMKAQDAQVLSKDSTQSTPKNNNKILTQYRKTLQDACTQSDPQAASQALLAYAGLLWPDQPPRNLAALASRVEQGAELIRELETVLYAAGNQSWQGHALWSAISNQLLQTKKKSVNQQHFDGAPPLYPDFHKHAG